MPQIADMPAMITAARSRNIRFFLVAQSLHQLQGKYGEDANTIKGNCDNWVFLTSREQGLLEEISALCGKTRVSDGTYRSLISTSELQRLRKEKGETLILHGREYPFITELADIDQYEAFKGYPSIGFEKHVYKENKIFELRKYHRKIINGMVPYPFSNGIVRSRQLVKDSNSSNDEFFF